MGKSVYHLLKNAGCEISNHYSDLYVKATKESRKILAENDTKYSGFISAVDGELWFDIPFAFDPFWVTLILGKED